MFAISIFHAMSTTQRCSVLLKKKKKESATLAMTPTNRHEFRNFSRISFGVVAVAVAVGRVLRAIWSP